MAGSSGKSSDPTRLHVLFESADSLTPNGSSYIRLIRPLNHPSLAGRLKASTGAELTGDDVDAVIVDRLWRADLTPGVQSRLLADLARRSVPYIYSIDDNLLDLNFEPGKRPFPTSMQRNLVREFIRSAAGVIVSTEPLAQRVSGLNGNVAVVPNQLDETLYMDVAGPSPAGDGTTVLGYMGTYSHFDDLMMIVHPLRRLLGKRPATRLEFVGVAAQSELLAMFPGANVRVLEVPSASVRYPEFTAWMQKNLKWDLAVAPLEINEFSRSKSDIKMLDYGILGIPGIFSRAPAYEKSVRHEATGWLVPNEAEAWGLVLERAVDSAALRETLSTAVRDEVRSSRTLAQHASDWLDAITALLAAARGGRRLPVPHWSSPR